MGSLNQPCNLEGMRENVENGLRVAGHAFAPTVSDNRAPPHVGKRKRKGGTDAAARVLLLELLTGNAPTNAVLCDEVETTVRYERPL
jgi:hypothetical protein